MPIIHGKKGTSIYEIYRGIRQRCNNPNDKRYRDYGGRGIRCEFASFMEFYAAVGEFPGPGYSIDRIDNNGNYALGNIRWATKIEQANNARTNRRIEYLGETRTLAEWARVLHFNMKTLQTRLDLLNWPIEKAFRTNVYVQFRHKKK